LLRACTHPYLLDAPKDENGDLLVSEDLIKQSGKFVLLDKMLTKLGRTGHKVIDHRQIRSIFIDSIIELGIDFFDIGHVPRSFGSDV
jgi:hypothetical protein